MTESGINVEDPNLRHVNKVTTIKNPMLSDSLNEFYETYAQIAPGKPVKPYVIEVKKQLLKWSPKVDSYRISKFDLASQKKVT